MFNFLQHLFTARALEQENLSLKEQLSECKATAIREAANNLRAAFTPQLAAFRLDQDKSALDIQRLLESGIDTLTVEMEKFRFYVSPQNLAAYDEACQEYQAIARIRAMNYEALGGKEPFKVFETRVHAVLRFTKETRDNNLTNYGRCVVKRLCIVHPRYGRSNHDTVLLHH